MNQIVFFVVIDYTLGVYLKIAIQTIICRQIYNNISMALLLFIHFCKLFIKLKFIDISHFF